MAKLNKNKVNKFKNNQKKNVWGEQRNLTVRVIKYYKEIKNWNQKNTKKNKKLYKKIKFNVPLVVKMRPCP